ncbi:MAG: CDGSH iron-sulfur domain-containing protein [Geminicoccaceae bacterium]
MDEAVAVQKEPYMVELKEGKTYAWCRCGRSAKQPFCDGSHKTTSLQPLMFEAKKNGKAFLCGCKITGNQPYCDGSHKTL